MSQTFKEGRQCADTQWRRFKRKTGTRSGSGKMPAWQRATSQSLESAAAEKRPIVLYFESERSTDFDLYGEDFAALSTLDAMFIKVAYTDSREQSPWAETSVVPTSKLLSDNPSRDYRITAGKATLVVCDWHGNDFWRTESTKIKAAALKTEINRVSKKATDAETAIQKHVDKARSELEKGSQTRAISALLSAFGTGHVGYDSMIEASRLYHELMDELRARKEELLEAKDAAGLRELAKIVKKTDLEKEVNNAIKSVR